MADNPSDDWLFGGTVAPEPPPGEGTVPAASDILDFLDTGVRVAPEQPLEGDMPTAEMEAVAQALGDNMALGEAVDIISAAAAAPPPARAAAGVQLSELVLLITSLGSVRKAFFGSRRAEQIVCCKKVRVVLVDVNKDVATGSGLINLELVGDWEQLKILKTEPDGHILLPQLLVDGVSVGNEVAMQDMEEDGDLDAVFRRMSCPNCLQPRPEDATGCASCGSAFRQLVAPELISAGKVAQLKQGKQFVGTDEPSAEIEPPLLAQAAA